MKKHLLLLLTIFLGLLSCTQKNENQFVVELNEYYDRQAKSFTVLYPLSVLADSIQNELEYPNLQNIADTTFAKIYYTGKNHSALENSILMLVGNYSTDSPIIWVDYNNNLDFTDGKDSLIFSKNFVDIIIPNSRSKDLHVTLRLFKPDSTQIARSKKFIEKYITKDQPYAMFYFSKRINIKVSDFVYKQDSLRIGVVDWNFNGVYNDLGADRIVFGKYKGKIKGTDLASGAIIIDSTNYFQGITKAFEVTKVAADGESVRLKPTLSANAKKRITEGESIPKISFTLLSGKQTEISKFLNDEKLIYLNFWANWCSGCHEEIDVLKKIHSKYSDRIQLISLNYNESTEEINAFLDKYNVEWLNGYSTSDINQKLLVYGLPRNILIDSTGTILEMDIHPLILLDRISKKSQ